MKLTQEDKKQLLEWGYPKEDIDQIQEAIKVCKITVDDKRISTAKAIEILGKTEFLSGISRSAFHWSALRCKNNVEVYFDSSKLFID